MELDEILPHRLPMRLIEKVEEFDAAAQRAVVSFAVDSRSPFFDGEGVPGWVAIEYMAQAAAALVGMRDRATSPGQPPKPGLLLGTRRLELSLDAFTLGMTYRTSAVCVFDDIDSAAFECAISDSGGRTVAAATLSAYRPPDMATFLRNQAWK